MPERIEDDFITIDPAVCEGQPCLTGTSTPVALVAKGACALDERDLSTRTARWDSLTAQQVREAVRFHLEVLEIADRMLPPGSARADYDAVVPGFFEVILDLAGKELLHARSRQTPEPVESAAASLAEILRATWAGYKAQVSTPTREQPFLRTEGIVCTVTSEDRGLGCSRCGEERLTRIDVLDCGDGRHKPPDLPAPHPRPRVKTCHRHLQCRSCGFMWSLYEAALAEDGA